jgi:AcrR family transcriptional regulator
MSQAPVETLKRKPGRPPDLAARQSVLDAAYRIVMEEGLGRLTIERVANETGVGKPTIYRFCTNAQELAMAAFLAQPEAKALAPRGKSVQAALRAHIGKVIDTFATQRGRQITLTMASADPESELAKAFRHQVILKSREVGRGLLALGIASGEIRPDVPMETVLDMLYGPLFFRLLTVHLPLSPAFAEQLVAAIFSGIAATGRRSKV